jgi:5'-3' exonuclease
MAAAGAVLVYARARRRLSFHMAKWLLVDGFNMAFWTFYEMPELTHGDGFPTGCCTVG